MLVGRRIGDQKFIRASEETWSRWSRLHFQSFVPHCWGTGLPQRLQTTRTGHNPPRGPSADWWVLTTANAAATNGLMCLTKHGAQDNKILVSLLMTDQRCLTSAIARRSTLTAGSSSSLVVSIHPLIARPLLLCVIHKEALCLSSGDINRVMMTMDCDQRWASVTSAVFS
jgi:hypothetical protein